MQPRGGLAGSDFRDGMGVGYLLDFLEKVTAATSIETVWNELTATMARHGFDRLIYGFTRYRTERSLGDPDDLMILSNHDRAYAEGFIGERRYQHSPMMRWAAGNTGARSWSWIEENADLLTEAEQHVVQYNRQMGVVAGYSISFPALSQRARGLLALTARPGMSQAEADAVWDGQGRCLLQLATVAHLKFTTLPFTGARRPLTDRQREALEWVGDGKTTQDIAVLMGLTPATVEKHLRLARKALDVETTAQAVLKASFQNQIFVIQPGVNAY
jgi:LuxR family transcriptional regulator